jgi:hypothetical protein
MVKEKEAVKTARLASEAAIKKKKDDEAAAKEAAAKPKGIVAKAQLPHEDYKTLATEWRESGNASDYESLVKEVTGPGPNKFATYKIVWNGDSLSPADVLRGFADGTDSSMVNMEASMLAVPFACSGITGNDRGAKGGGTTIFISKSMVIKPGQIVRYRYAPDGDAEPLHLVAELWLDPLAGLMGTKLGVIVGDFHTKVFDSKMRCYDLTRLINAVLRPKDVLLTVKSIKSDREGWQLYVYALGTAEGKRVVRAALKKGINIQWEEWVKPLKIIEGGRAAVDAKAEIAKNVTARIHQQNLDTDGRRLHVYKIIAEAAADETLKTQFTEIIEKYGAVAEWGLRPSKDGCAFAWIVYENAEDAEKAMEDDAIGTALSIDALVNPDIGYITAEMAYAADAAARRKPVAKIVIEEKSLVSQIPADADKWIAGILAQQATAAALIAGVVTPVLSGVGSVMKTEGKRIAIALGKQISKEMRPVLDAVEEQAKMIKKLTKMMEKMGPAPLERKRGRRSESPAGVKATAPAPSARKVKRSDPVQPPSSKKPSKRERSADGEKLKDFEELVNKIKSAEGGEAMLHGFMGKDFGKKQRAQSDEEMSDEEDEDEDTVQSGSESSDSE